MKKIYTGLFLLSASAAGAQTGLTNTGAMQLHSGAQLAISGALTNGASATLVNNGGLYLKGNLTNNQASMSAGSGTLYLNGGSVQTIGGTQAYRTANLQTNNSAGITLSNEMRVSGVHSFTSGIITASTSATPLTYENGASYSGSADSRHVNGWVRKIGAGDFDYPVGNGTYLRPMRIHGLLASASFLVRHAQPTPNSNQWQRPLVSVDPNENWIVTQESGGAASVTLNWDNSKIALPNWVLADILVAGYDGSLWTSQGGTPTGNVATTGSVTATNISSFNRLTIGSGSWVVPLKLVDFTAGNRNGYAQVGWTTEQEANVRWFDVERSADAVHFTPFTRVAARNSGRTEHYATIDPVLIQGTAYYRLRIQDADGRFEYSRIAKLTMNTDGLFNLVNPAVDALQLLSAPQLNGNYSYTIHTASGQLVQQGTVLISASGTSIPLQERKPGYYTLQLKKGDEVIRKVFVVR